MPRNLDQRVPKVLKEPKTHSAKRPHVAVVVVVVVVVVVELLFPGALPLASAGVGGFLHVFFLHCRELSSSGCAVQCSLPCILPSHHVCIGLPYGVPNVKFRKSLPGRRPSFEKCLVLSIRMANFCHLKTCQCKGL